MTIAELREALRILSSRAFWREVESAIADRLEEYAAELERNRGPSWAELCKRVKGGRRCR